MFLSSRHCHITASTWDREPFRIIASIEKMPSDGSTGISSLYKEISSYKQENYPIQIQITSNYRFTLLNAYYIFIFKNYYWFIYYLHFLFEPNVKLSVSSTLQCGNRIYAYANRLDPGQPPSNSAAGLRSNLFATLSTIPNKNQAECKGFKKQTTI